MKVHGDINSVNLRTGELTRRVVGNGEVRLERQVWLDYADSREKETTWLRDQNGTPDNTAIDEFMFREGFRKGIEYAEVKAAMEKAAREVQPQTERELAGEHITADVMEMRLR